MKSLALALVLFGWSACDGGSGNQTGDGSCTLTLSGARTGSFPCVASAAFTTADGMSTLSATAQPMPDGYMDVGFSVQVAGDVANKAYHDGDVTMGGATVVTTGLSSWVGGIGVGGKQGSIDDLTITSKTQLATSSGNTIYQIHGSLHATMTDSSAMGMAPIMMTSTF